MRPDMALSSVFSVFSLLSSAAQVKSWSRGNADARNRNTATRPARANTVRHPTHEGTAAHSLWGDVRWAIAIAPGDGGRAGVRSPPAGWLLELCPLMGSCVAVAGRTLAMPRIPLPSFFARSSLVSGVG